MTTVTGKCSWFGGAHDTGVGPHEGLAIVQSARQLPEFFLPDNGLGLARRLNPAKRYIAMRWNYHLTPVSWLLEHTVTVSAHGKSFEAQPVDWGPNIHTGRIADLSPALLHDLGLQTNGIVTVVIPLVTHVAELTEDERGLA
jgi:hypothetical protein